MACSHHHQTASVLYQKFIPHLAAPLSVLTALIPPNKTAEKAYTAYVKKKAKGKEVNAEGLCWRWDWLTAADQVFEECKSLLSKITGLIPLDYDAVKCDTSNTGIGAWLGAGNLPDTVTPIAYFSRSLIPAKTRYPVHDKEMPAIVEALKEWHQLLLGIPVNVMTDHATLQHCFTQPLLSDCQKRWSEVLNNYNLQIYYIPGVTNNVADTLSRIPHPPLASTSLLDINSILTIGPNEAFLDKVSEGYAGENIMGTWSEDGVCPPGVKRVEVQGQGEKVDVWMLGDRLCVPEAETLKETCLEEFHSAKGHFGVDKTLELLRQLVFGKRPTLAPPILAHTNLPAADAFHPTKEEWEIAARLMDLEEGEAKDRLLISKYQQAVQANRHRHPEPTYAVGDKVSMDTANFRHQYKTSTHQSAKLMPQWEGPFTGLLREGLDYCKGSLPSWHQLSGSVGRRLILVAKIGGVD
ncbi:hypothetical protein B9479_001856 [Cryptococcus floricola]|uniref:Reverse transcriptase RNase H-like domain-containing protein n=1 Tax=Cryptococcus floricola TaxID=2591691 RepID=A0A5D3B3J0_9TREE|nr:hypothetical protein B9479_001856 [Cryptococcus floricola]